MSRPLVLVQGRFEAPTTGWQRRLASQVAYLGHDHTPLFTVNRTLSATAARAVLAEACGPHVAFHRLVVSLRQSSALTSVSQAHSLTRALLDDLSEHLQAEVVWVAAIHTGTDNLHSHVLVGGAARLRSTTRQVAVTLHPADYAFLRARGTHWVHALTGEESRRRLALLQYIH